MNFDKLEDTLKDDGIVFLAYGGFMTQNLISGMTEALEKEVETTDLSMKISHNLYTIFIELSQNMMNYNKSHPELDEINYRNRSLIIVGLSEDYDSYFVVSRNQILAEDKIKLEARLKEIEHLDKEQLRALYRDKRKNGSMKQGDGAGIGFIEIARRCDTLEHNFIANDNGGYSFIVKASITK